MDYRTLLAAVLGVGLGAVMVAFPEAVVKVHTAGRRPHDRHGEYGTNESGHERYHRLVRGLGVVVALAGVYFGATLVV